MKLTEKRVLVTGADGFIGSHLVERLVQQQGASVRALVQYNSFNSWGWLEELPSLDGVEVVSGDIRDPHFCHGLLAGIDVVFHLAALIPIPYSYVAPDSYVDTNVKGTLNLCQAARANRIEKFVQTSTSEVYGTAQYTRSTRSTRSYRNRRTAQPRSPPIRWRSASSTRSICRSWWRGRLTHTGRGSRLGR